MMTLHDLRERLDTYLDIKRYAEDSNGLVVQGRPEVHQVFGAVDLSWFVLNTSARAGVDLIFSHHAAWRSTDSTFSEEKYSFARKAGISIYVAHDSLDRHGVHGTAMTLAAALSYSAPSGFADGLGLIVKTAEGDDFDSFVRSVRAKVNPEALAWRFSNGLGRVAILPGWGARPEWMNLSREAGAQTFLSGEAIHFGKLYAKEAGLNLVLAGHHATEFFAIRSMMEWMAKELQLEAKAILDQESMGLF